jgi:N6-adenosine-specific RNA methylase IME4
MSETNLKKEPDIEKILESKDSNESASNDDKKKEIWVNSIKADGGAYKGCPKNDYCQHFVDTGERPQNFIRDYEEEKRFLDYPKLNELIKRKNEVLQKRATPPMWLKCDLKGYDLSTLGKFDVILMDPPLKEYKARMEAAGMDTSDMSFWSFEEISNLRMDHLAENCCFLFLWVGSSDGLDKGRLLLKKWNFRRCEDIVWIKTNRHNFKRRYPNTNDTLLQHTKEHCLVGIRGQVKRGVDGHFIHANIDTDVIVSEEPPLGSNEKPQELYRIIERFCLGRKRIELFGEDHNRRPGWLTLGKSVSSSNFDIEKYNSYFRGEFCYPEVQGYEGGRFVGCTPEIENLRPRSPSRNPPQIAKMNPNPGFLPGYNLGIGFNFNPNPMSNLPSIPNMSNLPIFNNNYPVWHNQDISRINSGNSAQYGQMMSQVGNLSGSSNIFEYSTSQNLGNGNMIPYNSHDEKDIKSLNNTYSLNQN